MNTLAFVTAVVAVMCDVAASSGPCTSRTYAATLLQTIYSADGSNMPDIYYVSTSWLLSGDFKRLLDIKHIAVNSI